MNADRLRRAKQVDEKDDVLNGEKRNRERLSLLLIRQEFGKSVDWLLTGKAQIERTKKVTKH